MTHGCHGGFSGGHHSVGHHHHSSFHSHHHSHRYQHNVHHQNHSHHHKSHHQNHGHHQKHHHHHNHHKLPHHRHHFPLPWQPSISTLPCAQACISPSGRALRLPRRSELVVIGGGVAEQLGHIGRVSVRLPADAVADHGGVKYFGIDVVPEDQRAPWRVMRRYNQFYSLACSRSEGLKIRPFPRKHLGQCTGAKLEARRLGLELWLSTVLNQGLCSGPSWISFLVAGRFAVPALEFHDCLSVPEVPELSAPPMEASRDGLELMQVQLPAGISHGDLLEVVTPGGQKVVISVPWGVAPGSPLELWYDPIDGTLGVQPEQDFQALR